jgi:hypothetical protein
MSYRNKCVIISRPRCADKTNCKFSNSKWSEIGCFVGAFVRNTIDIKLETFNILWNECIKKDASEFRFAGFLDLVNMIGELG